MELFAGAFEGKNVLVTGHTGFKGAWLCAWLLKLGAKVTGFALPPDTTPNLYDAASINKGMTSVFGDVRDKAEITRVFDDACPEVVFHLAAQSLVRRSYVDPVGTFETNIMGTINVLEAIRKSSCAKAAIMVTSDKCYENLETDQGYAEEDRLGGADPYSASKGATEIAVNAYSRSFFKRQGSPGIATARAGNVIGGGDWSEDRLVPDSIRALAADKIIEIRHPQSTRPWQHVLDPLYGYMLIAASMLRGEGEVSGAWNIGPREEKTVKWVVEEIIRLWGSGSWRAVDPDERHEAKILRLDCSKAERLLGLSPTWDVKTALQKTIEWYAQYYKGERADIKMIEQIEEYESALLNRLKGRGQ